MVVHPVTAQRPDTVDPSKQVTVGVIGITPPPDVLVHYGPVESAKQTVGQVGSLSAPALAAVASLPAKIGQLVGVLFDNQPRDPNGAVGVVGISRISGDIAQSDLPWQGKVSTLLMLLAGFNIFVGVFNMLPLLPLDGGHVAVLAYERAAGLAGQAQGAAGAAAARPQQAPAGGVRRDRPVRGRDRARAGGRHPQADPGLDGVMSIELGMPSVPLPPLAPRRHDQAGRAAAPAPPGRPSAATLRCRSSR